MSLFATSLMLLAAQDATGTAIDAERAMNLAAQRDGQWTALRRGAAPGAILFTPQPVDATIGLPTADPKISVQWWPAESYASCDGRTAVNTGPWIRPGSVGYFTTVWEAQPDGAWKWSLDHGDALETPRVLPEEPKVRRASCEGAVSNWMHEPCLPELKCGHGLSADRTLHWDWMVHPDGSRSFTASLWNGTSEETVINDQVAAPTP